MPHLTGSWIRKPNKIFEIQINKCNIQCILGSAAPSRLGALHKTYCVVSRGGEGNLGFGMKEWRKRIIPCFTPSRIALTDSARETVSLPHFLFFLSHARDCTTFTLHDLTDFYVERVTAHHIKITIINFFITAGQLQKWNQSENIFETKGAPGVSGALRSLRILRIRRIGSDSEKWSVLTLPNLKEKINWKKSLVLTKALFIW